MMKKGFNSKLCHSSHCHYSIITLKGGSQYHIVLVLTIDIETFTLSPSLLGNTAPSINLKSQEVLWSNI
jgi:hypothetical protein